MIPILENGRQNGGEWDKEKPVIEAHRKAWLESGLTLAEFNGKLEGNEP